MMDDNTFNTTLNCSNGEFMLCQILPYITKASKIFAPIMYLNFMLILVFSTLWALYLIPKLWKDYSIEKITFKLRNNQPEYLWINRMENFRSNRIKNIILLAICLSEIGYTISIVFGSTLWILSGINDVKNEVNIWLLGPSFSFPSYRFLVEHSTYRFTNSITTTSVCATAFFIRILTEYMVYQYSYYKFLLKLNLKVYISLTCLSVLFIIATLFKLLMVYNICIVLILCYEYIQLIIEGRKLRLSLRQRLYDATNHENQSNFVILYYQIAYKEYKYCSTIMLIALFAQYMGLSLYLLNQNVGSLIEQNFLTFYSCNIKTLFELSSLLQLIFISFGTSIQIVLYLIVSIRRLFRYIHKRINLNTQISSSRSSLQLLIARHNLAYRRKNDYRNMFY